MKQYTYMMLKPDAFVDHKNQRVLEILAQHQLHVEKSQVVQVDRCHEDFIGTLSSRY